MLQYVIVLEVVERNYRRNSLTNAYLVRTVFVKLPTKPSHTLYKKNLYNLDSLLYGQHTLLNKVHKNVTF